MTLEMDQEEIAPPAAVICFTFAELRRQMMAISATKLLVGKGRSSVTIPARPFMC